MATDIHLQTVKNLQNNPNALGEYLRQFWFVEMQNNPQLFGCYTTDVVIAESTPMTKKQRSLFVPFAFSDSDIESDGVPADKWCEEDYKDDIENSKGYVLRQGDLQLECFWLWDGDGFLLFRVFEKEQLVAGVSNSDCKKNYVWKKFSFSNPLPSAPL